MSVHIINPDTGREVFTKSTVEVVLPEQLDHPIPKGHVAVVAAPGIGRPCGFDLATYPESWVVVIPD